MKYTHSLSPFPLARTRRSRDHPDEESAMRLRRRGVNGLHSVCNGSNAGFGFLLIGLVSLEARFLPDVRRNEACAVPYTVVLRWERGKELYRRAWPSYHNAGQQVERLGRRKRTAYNQRMLREDIV